METDYLVRLNKIHFSYGKHTVFSGLDFLVPKGEVIGILGPIGAGKTLLLRLIAGLEKPQRGTVEFARQDESKRVSFAFQNDVLLPWLSVADNLKLCLRRPDIRLEDSAILKDLGLLSLMDKFPHQLSGGMRKKVNFARAFINKDPFVLMDEPFGALDPSQKLELQRNFLKRVEENSLSAIVVTHDIQEAFQVCDRVYFLSGREKRLKSSIVNEFRGNFEFSSIFAMPRYREFYQLAMDFYSDEGTR